MEANHTGLYQFSSTLGTVERFIEKMGYRRDFEGLKAGTEEFDNKWRAMAKDTTPTFESNQWLYIRNRFYLTQLTYLHSHGIDFSERGPAIQDMIWSTAVQFGPETSLIIKALDRCSADRMSDKEIITLVQNYKIINNDKLFRSSSDAVRRGTLSRAEAELQSLLALIAKEEPDP